MPAAPLTAIFLRVLAKAAIIARVGHWWTVSVDEHIILSGKYAPPDEVLSVFERGDLVHDVERQREMEILGDLLPNIVRYEVISQVAIDRLNVMGFSYGNSLKDYATFQSAGTEDGQEVEEWIEENSADLRKTVDDYLTATQHGYHDCLFWDDLEDGVDSRILISIALNITKEQSMLILDLTDIMGEDYTDDLDWAESARENIRVRAARDSKTIILTEGKFDSRVLRKTLELLRPHVASYFSFLEFEANNIRIPGGSDRVGDAVRRFTSAGIGNRIIAIFDNDGAGRAEWERLSSLALPNTVRILTIPVIEYAGSYPSIDQAGNVTETDVNGTACSIEFCFGEQLLLDGNGRPIPIYFGGNVASFKQGAFSRAHKGLIQKRIESFLDECQSNESELAALRSLPASRLIELLISPFE